MRRIIGGGFAAMAFTLAAWAQAPAPIPPVPTPSPDVIMVIELRQSNYVESIAGGEMNRLGAVRTGRGDLFADAAMTRRVGETHLSCANTAVEGDQVIGQICNGVFRLNNGMIFWQSMVSREDRAARRINYVVNGGTGAYIGARGYGVNRFHERPTYQHMFLVALARQPGQGFIRPAESIRVD